jgi:hypothetical protein
VGTAKECLTLAYLTPTLSPEGQEAGCDYMKGRASSLHFMSSSLIMDFLVRSMPPAMSMSMHDGVFKHNDVNILGQWGPTECL